MDTIYEDGEDYELMGVDRNVTLDELRKAYKRLCLQYHPDKNGSATDFIRLTEAYRNIQRNIERTTGTPSPEADYSLISFMCDMLMGYIKKVRSGKNIIRLQIHAKLEDVVNEKIKRVTLNVQRLKDSVVVKERKDLYIGLCAYQDMYVFKGVGDEYAPKEYGDVVVQVLIDCEAGYSVLDGKHGTILYELYVPVYTYLYEDHVSFTYLDKSTLVVEFDVTKGFDPIIVKSRGCIKEDGSYGDLHVKITPYMAASTKNTIKKDYSLKEKILHYFATL